MRIDIVLRITLFAALLIAPGLAAAAERLIDLAPVANMGFRDEIADDGVGGWTDQGGNDFRAMPTGRHSLCGIDFQIIDPAKNKGKSCLVLRGRERPKFPLASRAQIGAKAAAVAFLHAAAWAGDARKPLAHYVVRYADGKEIAIPIRAGQEVQNWWSAAETEDLKVAVQTSNLARRDVFLHAWSWRNPRPDTTIASIDFRSANTGGVPIIVAATLLDKIAPLTSERWRRGPDMTGVAWMEGEAFTSANVPNSQADWNSELFSGGVMMGHSMATEVKPLETEARKVFDEGAFKLAYDFDADKNAAYTLWARTGPAQVYAPFRWRVDGGEWGRIAHQDAFLDQYEITFFQTLGWVRLGVADLTAGKHTLHVEVPRPGKDDLDAMVGEMEDDELLGPKVADRNTSRRTTPKKVQRWMMQFDCFVAARVPFHSNGALKPGEEINRFPWDERARQAFRDFTSEKIAADGRDVFELDGAWQMARDQEPLPSPHLADKARLRGPITTAPDPATLAWMGVTVPHTKDRPELGLLHRRWYRQFVSLPHDLKGKRVSLHFSEANYTASIFVNGRLCGTHVGGYVPFAVDITDALKPGERNEVLVGIKGLYFYMRDFNPWMPSSRLRAKRSFLAPGLPGWHKDNRTGLPGSVWIETHGQVSGRDIFVQSKYAERRLEVSLAIDNRSAADFSGRVRMVVVEPTDGAVVAAFGEQALTLAADGSTEISVRGAADGLTPWWPGKPKLYVIRVEIVDGAGKVVDVCEDRFGFREVGLEKHYFTVNGKRYNFRNVISGGGETLAATMAEFRASNGNHLRLPHSGYTKFFAKDAQRATLRYMDEQGVPVRFCSQINGMFITVAIGDPEFWRYSTEHLRQMIRAYRNHPSIMVWVAENELDLISNMANREAPKRRQWEMMAAARELDPSRPMMADGAGDLLGQSEICNWHYPEVGPIVDPNNLRAVAERQRGGVGLAQYPDNAFTLARVDRSEAIRPWDRRRPLWVGETYFYSGKVSQQSWIGGDQAMAGRFAANRASVRFVNMLGRGYRWVEAAGFNLFVHTRKLPGERIKNTLAPVAVFAREYNRNFYAGKPIRRRVRIFNDTLDGSPINFERQLQIDGKTVHSEASAHQVREGFHEELIVELPTPAAAARTAAKLVFRLSRGGQTVFEEDGPIWLHPPIARLKAKADATVWTLDPSGVVTRQLTAWGLRCRPVRRLGDVRDKTGLVVVGPGAGMGGLGRLAAFVKDGGRALILEQERPVAANVLPLPLKSVGATGAFAFPRGAHPALKGIGERDLCCWANGHVSFKGAYRRSVEWPVIVEASSREGMDLAPVVELPWGKGHYLLSQMQIERNLGQDPIADRLLANFVSYLLEPPSKPARLAALPSRAGGEDVLLARGKVAYSKLGRGLDLSMSLEAAFAEQDVVTMAGTADNIRAVNGALAALRELTGRGGWIVVLHLEKGAAKELSRLVGERLIVRPVGQERLVVTRPDDPLMVGIGNADLYQDLQLTKEQLLEAKFLHGDAPLATGVFSGALIYDDVCGLTRQRALANGLTSEDHWKYISYRGDGPLRLDWREPFKIEKVVVRENRHYKRMTQMSLILGNDRARPLARPVPRRKQPIVFEFEPRAISSITLTPTEFEVVKPGPMGWDTVEIYRQLSPSFRRKVIPLTRPAGIVKFPMGKGGILLNMTRLRHPGSNRLFLQQLHNLGVPRGPASKAGGGGEEDEMLLDF